MQVTAFYQALKGVCGDCFCGVPDSQLKAFCDYLMEKEGISQRHIIAANEGNCAAIAAGYYLATGKVPVVYMQNSGIGNIINPAASLLHDKVYGIPCLFVVGWRGEPGVHDEPQHLYQGEVTIRLLEDMDFSVFVVDRDTSPEQLQQELERRRSDLEGGKSVALVIKKGALAYEGAVSYHNRYTMKREEIIRLVTEQSADDIVVSTTGKASRELFEIREHAGQGHQRDFLTVGSMGHSSSIALGIALQKKASRVWCIDGDGAALMHMGAMAVIGSMRPHNLIHIVINNNAHETVGGMPTVAGNVDLPGVARACGYERAVSVDSYEELSAALKEAKQAGVLTLIEAKSAIGSRADLGRPTTTAKENKQGFMEYVKGKD